jgi:hypothetical protein
MNIIKKRLVVCAVLLGIPFFMHGQEVSDEVESGRGFLYNEYTGPVVEEGPAEEKARPVPAWAGWTKSDSATLRSAKRESRRYFEIGILNLNLNVTGFDTANLLNGSIFNFDSLDSAKAAGFSANLGLFTNPIYFKVSVKNAFHLDFFTGADINVNFDLPQKTISTLSDIENIANTPAIDFDPFGDIPTQFTEYKVKLEKYMQQLQAIDAGMSANASMFAEMGLGVSKNLLGDRLYVRAAPSLFFTLLYMKQNAVSLKGYSSGNKYGLKGDGSMKLYSAWDLDKDFNPFTSPGVDLTLEACYALLPILDTGISISHIPVIPSTLNHGKSIDASDITIDVSVPDTEDEFKDFFLDPGNAININIPDTEELLKDSEDENKKVMRPTRFDFYALLKPFKSPIFVVRPNVGFTVNSTVAPALFNWGLDLCFNAPVIFSIFAGTGLTESIWAQRIGIMLDFRVFEVDIGSALTGKTFTDCFSDQNGLSLGINFKLGF